MDGGLNRRTVLQSGALAAAALAFGGSFWTDPAWADVVNAESARPITGRLVAWLVIEPEREASLRLAELDAELRPRAITSATLPASSVMAAGAETDAQVLAAVAQSWRVPPTECAVGHGRIVHLPSGRWVPYAVWVDFA